MRHPLYIFHTTYLLCFSCTTDNQREKPKHEAGGTSAAGNAVVALGGGQAVGGASRVDQMIGPHAEVRDTTIQPGDAGNTEAHGYVMCVLSYKAYILKCQISD